MDSHGIGPADSYLTRPERQVTLCELLDRVLNKGAVLTGEVVVSVAGVELLYVGLGALVSSVETLLESIDTCPTSRGPSYVNT